MYRFLYTACFTCVFFLSVNSVKAQVDDNVLWAAIKVHKSFNSKTSAAITPILRLDDDISHYQNFSVDVSVKHKFAKNWHGQILSRTWFLPDNIYRKFFFFDIGYSQTISQFKVSSYFRTHYALTIKDRKDADFFRLGTTVSLLSFKKIQPYVFIEPWLRLNGENEFQRLRYGAGIKWQINDPMNLTIGIRPQPDFNVPQATNFNHFILTLAYKLP